MPRAAVGRSSERAVLYTRAMEESLYLLAGLAALLLLLWRLAWFLTRHANGAARAVARRAAPLVAWLRGHRRVAALAARYPRLHRHVAARLDPGRFRGLPLTLLVLGAAYVAALIGGLIEELLERGELQRFDTAVHEYLEPWREPAAITVVAWVTDLGASQALVATGLVCTALFAVWGRRRLILPLWTTFLGAQAFTWTGKYFFDRPRPEFAADIMVLSPSFPSGHATGAMALYGFLAYVIARDAGSLRRRFEVIYWCAALVALVGLSRVYLGVHYPSDVATGWLVGGFWLLVGTAVAEYPEHAGERRH